MSDKPVQFIDELPVEMLREISKHLPSASAVNMLSVNKNVMSKDESPNQPVSGFASERAKRIDDLKKEYQFFLCWLLAMTLADDKQKIERAIDVIDIPLPEGWNDIVDGKLPYFYLALAALMTSDDCKKFIFRHYVGMHSSHTQVPQVIKIMIAGMYTWPSAEEDKMKTMGIFENIPIVTPVRLDQAKDMWKSSINMLWNMILQNKNDGFAIIQKQLMKMEEDYTEFPIHAYKFDWGF